MIPPPPIPMRGLECRPSEYSFQNVAKVSSVKLFLIRVVPVSVTFVLVQILVLKEFGAHRKKMLSKMAARFWLALGSSVAHYWRRCNFCQEFNGSHRQIAIFSLLPAFCSFFSVLSGFQLIFQETIDFCIIFLVVCPEFVICFVPKAKCQLKVQRRQQMSYFKVNVMLARSWRPF